MLEGGGGDKCKVGSIIVFSLSARVCVVLHGEAVHLGGGVGDA